METPLILWADDDHEDIAIMREVMDAMDSNHEIVEMSNGLKVIEYLESAKLKKAFPCLIVLDMNMPVLSGRETLPLIKKDPAYAKIPIVVFTTSESKMDRIFCDHFGVEMITKPLNYNMLEDAIQHLLSYCTS